MKQLLIILFSFSLLQSCKKDQITAPQAQIMSDDELYQRTLLLGAGGAAKGGWFPPIWMDFQTGRISGWLMSNQDNFTLSRKGYDELLYSDNFVDDIDENDKRKAVDTATYMVMANPLINSMLWKQERYYKHYNDTIQLRIGNFKQDTYYLKFSGSNFPVYPEKFTAVLVDKYTGAVIDIPTQNNEIIWYQFNVNEGKKSRDKERFYIVLREDWG